jgi:DNA-binding transcriptional MerR regulator
MLAADPSEAAMRYSVQDVAQATGIPVNTFLAWEHRYGIPRPRRGPGGRRLYSGADVALLQAMRARTVQGVRAEMAARELLGDDSIGNPRPGRRLVLAHVLTEVQELRCLLCGETSGELLTQRTGGGTRARFVLTPGVLPPSQGPSGRPRCGRCAGDLFREPAERRRMPPFIGVASIAPGPDAA